MRALGERIRALNGVRISGQGMVETGLVMGLIAILALATIFVVAEWAGESFRDDAGSQSQSAAQFNSEMAAKAGGIAVNSTSVSSTTSTATSTTSTGSTTTSSGTTTTSSGSTTTSSGSTTTSSGSTTTSSGSTSTSSNSTTTSSNSTTTSSNSTTTSSASTSTSTTTSVASCAPTITSVTTNFGCTLTPGVDNALTHKKNTTYTYTINLGGTTACVTTVSCVTMSGGAISSYPVNSDTTSPYQVQIKTVNSSGQSSVVEFRVYEGGTIKATFQCTIYTAASNAC